MATNLKAKNPNCGCLAKSWMEDLDFRYYPVHSLKTVTPFETAAVGISLLNQIEGAADGAHLARKTAIKEPNFFPVRCG